ncbi:MAG: extracellular solute-binding protein [Promethearchaeota archaeon]
MAIILTTLIVFSLGMSISYTSISYNANALEPKPSAVTVELWYTENPTETATLLTKIAMFEALNPTITVDAEAHGFFDVSNDFRVAFVAGEEPDVLRTPRDDVPWFAYDGLILPLTDEFTPADKDDFLEASLKLMTYGGEIWGFPQAIDCPMFLFNKELFNASGFDASVIDWNTSWTWPQFSANIAQLNQTAGVYSLSLAGMFYGAQPFYYGQGGYFVENGIYDVPHIAINNNKTRDALTFMKNVTDSAFTPPWEEQGWSYFVGDFGSGKVAMIATGPWEIVNLITNTPQFNGDVYGPDNLGFMQLPHDAEDNYGALVGGNYYTISSQIDPAKYDAAVLLAKFLSSHTAMALSAINDYHIPARKSVMTNASVMAAPSFKYVEPYYQQAINAFQLQPSPYYGRMENAFGTRVDEYLAGDINLDECIDKTIKDWYDIPLPGVPAAAEQVTIPGFPIPVVVAVLLTGIVGVIVYMIRKREK